MRRLTLLLLIILGAPAAALAQMGALEFEKTFEAAFEERYPGQDLEKMGPFSFEVRGGDAGDVEFKVNIERAYEEYLFDPSNLESVLAKWLVIGDDLLAEFDSNLADSLVAMPRPRAYLEYLKTEVPEGELPLYRDFVGDLVVILMVNSEDYLRGANLEDLETTGLAPDQAWQRAYGNAPKIMGQVSREFDREYSVMLTQADSALIAAKIADPDFCSSDDPLASEHILLLDRDLIASSRGGSEKAVLVFWIVFGQPLAEGALFSNTPFVCENGMLKVATAP
ncbi:MAG: hypothetical protein AAFY19_08895 [Pseudomonadota bacterium]